MTHPIHNFIPVSAVARIPSERHIYRVGVNSTFVDIVEWRGGSPAEGYVIVYTKSNLAGGAVWDSTTCYILPNHPDYEVSRAEWATFMAERKTKLAR